MRLLKFERRFSTSVKKKEGVNVRMKEGKLEKKEGNCENGAHCESALGYSRLSLQTDADMKAAPSRRLLDELSVFHHNTKDIKKIIHHWQGGN